MAEVELQVQEEEEEELSEEEEEISEEVHNSIKSVIQQHSIKNYVIDISVVPARGCLATIVKVVVNGENEDGKKRNLNLIVKCAPTTRFERLTFPVREFYLREIYVYKTIFSEFAKFQKEKNIEKPINSFAKFYTSSIDKYNEVLILEDMNVLGYRLWELHEPYDYNHAILAVREYGKLHAMSYALRDQKPKLFQKLTKDLEGIVVQKKGEIERMVEAYKYSQDTYLACLDPIKDKVAYDKFVEYFKTMLPRIKNTVPSKVAGKYAVLEHGESWINKFLYKYENEEEPLCPTKIIVLDWQVMRLASPALDFSYLIFSSTDKELRDEHYEHLMEEYYHSLSSHLIALGSNPKIMFPYEIFKEHLTKFAHYGLYESMSVLLAASATSIYVEDLPDVDSNEVNMGNIADSFRSPQKPLGKYTARLKGIVLDCVKYNYI